MDKVRLEVRETSMNSEKPKPKASKPPILSARSKCRKGESSVALNSFSDIPMLSPDETHREERSRSQMCLCTRNIEK